MRGGQAETPIDPGLLSAFFEGQGLHRGVFQETGLASQARHELGVPDETFAIANRGRPATSRIGLGCSTTELRLHMAEAVTCIPSALSNCATDKRRDGNPAILAAGAGFEPARPFGLHR